MKKKKGLNEWLSIVLIIITMLAFGKFTEVTWFAFVWFPLVFSIAYYLDEIIGWFKFKIKSLGG